MITFPNEEERIDPSAPTPLEDKSGLTYVASPTMARFHADRSFYRGIMGPFRSGKSTGCVQEALMVAARQAPWYDSEIGKHVRRTRGVVIRNCFDTKTEILTERRGWVRFPDLHEDDCVASLEDGHLRFVRPSYYYAARHQGEMIGFEGEGADFLVTPNHRLYVSKLFGRAQKQGSYRFALASDLYGSRDYSVRRDAAWEGTAQEWTVDQFEWFGFFFAEGHIAEGNDNYRRRRFVLTQVLADGVRYARELCQRAAIQTNESVNSGITRFHVALTRRRTGTGDRLFELLRDIGKSTSLKVPDWIKNAPPAHLCAFLKGYIAGDGCIGKSTVAYTSSSQLADDIQDIALRAGMVANIRRRERNGMRMTIGGRETKTNADQYTVTFVRPFKYTPLLRKTKGRYRGWYKLPYDDMVYCVEVPSHIVYVRRNGVAHWSSQTYPELISTTIRTWQAWIPASRMRLVYKAPITGRLFAPACIDGKLDGTYIDMEVDFLAMERADDKKKLLGTEYTWAWVNEAREISEEIIDFLGRVGSFPYKQHGGATWSGIFMDTNPPNTRSWWYKKFELKKPDNWACFKQPPALLRTGGAWSPNPAAENVQNLEQGYLYYLRMISGKDVEWVKVYVAGEYGSTFEGKPVYELYYRDSEHLSPVPLGWYRGIPLMGGMDYGLTPAFILGQVTPHGALHVLREYIGEYMGIAQLLDEVVKPALARDFPGAEIGMCDGDPSGKNRSQADASMPDCFEICRQRGIPARPAKTNDIVIRRQAVIDWLSRRIGARPAFQLDPSCTILREGFLGGYRFAEVQALSTDPRYKDLPEKDFYSHPHDGLQYMCMAVSHPALKQGRKRAPEQTSTSGWGRFR